MKLTELGSAYKALASLEKPFALLLIDGSDDFFREDCVERYIEFWKRTVLNGAIRRLTLGDLLARRHGFQNERSLFGTKSLYVVDEIAGKKGSDLLPVIANADPDCYFLLCTSETPPPELVTEASTIGASIHIPPLKPWDRQPYIVRWIQAFIKKRGKTIASDAANILAQAYSSDRHGLIQELEKLLTYRTEAPEITMHDVEAVGIIELQPTMWQLLDGLLAGDEKAVVDSLSQATDMHDIAVLRFLKNQLEKLLMAFEEGAPPRNKPQERQMAIVRKRGAPTIVSWINRLKMQEIAIRSGLEDGENSSLLPLFISLLH